VAGQGTFHKICHAIFDQFLPLLTNLGLSSQWGRHIRACQDKCPDRNTSALSAALAVKSGNNILIALAGATKHLSMPCHEQQTGAATVRHPKVRHTFELKTKQLVGL